MAVVHKSYIPQHKPEGRMLFYLGNVTYLLDVTPSNPLPHPLSLPPIPLCVIQVQQILAAKQHPTNYVIDKFET